MKEKKKKQQAVAKVAASAHTSVFDLTRIKPTDYGAPLAQLFHSVEWHDAMVRRNKLLRGYLASCDKTELMKRHLALDRKIADMLLDALVGYHDKLENIRSSRTITLSEYKNDFVKTADQTELYNNFQQKLDIACSMFDMAEGQLLDAKELLRKLDPDLYLSEFDGIEAVLSTLRSQSCLRYRNEHPELSDLYTDYISNLEVVVLKHTYEFLKEFKPLHDRLVAEGKVKRFSNEEVKPLY